MERFKMTDYRTKKTILFISFFSIFFSFHSFAQTPSVIRNIRLPLWAELDAYPGLSEAQNLESGQYDYPIKAIKEVAPFLINGMVYGWSFSYTPSDKQRNVEEYLEVKELYNQSYILPGISYDSPWIQNNRLNCWCNFTRNEIQIQYYNLWTSIENPIIHGRGYGDLTSGFNGLLEASKNALKEAVRAYYRNLIKNKPKEITGKVLIKSLPTIGISSGR